MISAGLPEPISQRIIYVHRLSAVLFPALLVFSPALPNILLIIIGTTGLLTADYTRLTRFKGKEFIAAILLFILWKFIGIIYSEDTGEAWSLFLRQLPLLAIPFIFLFPEKLSASDAKRAFYLFSIACLFMAFYSLGASLYTYRNTLQYVGGTNIYSFVPLHPAYFSMYLVLVFFFLLREGIRRIRLNQMRRAAMFMAFSGFLFIYLLIINARTTTILFVALLGLTALYYMFKGPPRFRYITVAASLLISIGAFSIVQNSYMVQNDLINRFGAALDTRLEIWAAGWETALEHPVFGSGTGDSRIDLFATYEENGMEEALLHRYNTHSQYLETWIRHGVIGVGLLLLIFGVLLKASNKLKTWVFGVFVMLFAGECLTEVMLDRQMGIYFFGSFAALFYCMNNPRILYENHA